MLGMTLVTALVLLVVIVVFPRRLDALALEGLHDAASSDAALLAALAGPAGDDPEALAQALDLVGQSRVLRAAVIRSQGEELARFASAGTLLPERPPHVQAPTPGAPVSWADDEASLLHVQAALEGAPPRTLHASADLYAVRESASDNLAFSALVGAGVALVAWLSMAVVASSITSPVRRLTSTAQQVASGHLDLVHIDHQAIAATSADEVAQLTRAFGLMIERIRGYQQSLEARFREEEAQRREAERDKAEAEAQRERLREALDLVETTQTQLVEAEKLATLGQLVAGIAHEVNTPLGAIVASTSVIEDSLMEAMLAFRDVFGQPGTPAARAAEALIHEAADRDARPSSREQRRIRRALARTLSARGLPVDLADRLLELGVSPEDPRGAALLDHPDPTSAIRCTEDLATVRRNVANIHLAASRARAVVLALKTFARTGPAGEERDIDLAASISTVLTLYRSQLKLGIEVQFDYDGATVVRGNPDELSQVWTNLVQNAIQAMSNQGTLRIELSTDDHTCEARFSNDGPPIPPEVLPRIFDPFFTTKPPGEGSGLGLDIVRKVVEQHGGSMEVDSTPAWTTFLVRLPLAAAEGDAGPIDDHTVDVSSST